jgi:hypothetical protein
MKGGLLGEGELVRGGWEKVGFEKVYFTVILFKYTHIYHFQKLARLLIG